MFTELVKRAGITKAELGRRMGVSSGTVSSWRDSAPHYAIVYLELLIEFNRGVIPVVGKFDRAAYQREYMRRRRLKIKTPSP